MNLFEGLIVENEIVEARWKARDETRNNRYRFLRQEELHRKRRILLFSLNFSERVIGSIISFAR